MTRSSGHDDGYFPRGRSMLRRGHEELAVGLLYGQRALCIGAVKPLNYVGTSEHSYAKETTFRRLVHTGNAFEQIYFGSRGRGRPRPALRGQAARARPGRPARGRRGHPGGHALLGL